MNKLEREFYELDAEEVESEEFEIKAEKRVSEYKTEPRRNRIIKSFVAYGLVPYIVFTALVGGATLGWMENKQTKEHIKQELLSNISNRQKHQGLNYLFKTFGVMSIPGIEFGNWMYQQHDKIK